MIIKTTENTKVYSSMSIPLNVQLTRFNNISINLFIRKYQFFFVGPVFFEASSLFSVDGLLRFGGGAV
jgi:hypothetical protein